MLRSGIFFYIRNLDTNQLWKASYENNQDEKEKYEVVFADDSVGFTKSKQGIETELKIIVASTLGTEIRSLKIKNNSEKDIELDVIGMFQPALAKMEDDVAHPAFSNLFLKYSTSKAGDLIVTRNKRGNNESIYLGTNLFVDGSEKTKMEYEIDGTRIDDIITNQEPFSSQLGLVTEPTIALKRKIKIMPGKDVTLNLVICVAENLNEVLKNLEYYKIQENVKLEFNIARAKAEEETRYLNLSRTDLEIYNKILPYIVQQNPMKSLYMENIVKKEFKQSDFWKYGISGDIPIILVTARFANDIYTVKEMLKVHEILRIKGIKTDLVILDYEKNIYEQYVKEQIIQEILNMQIGYLQNISGGIFLLNSNEIEDEELFKLKANIIINASKGNAKEAIKEMEDEYKRRMESYFTGKNAIKNSVTQRQYEQIKPNIDFENLKCY